MDIVGIGIALALVGIAFLGLIRALLRMAARMQPGDIPAANDSVPVEIDANPEATWIVQPGGRVSSVNAQARQVFDLVEQESPTLERLARSARPVEAFYNVCATEGRARFSISGRPVEAFSYRIPNDAMLVALRYTELAPNLASAESGVAAQTLQTFTDLTQAMAGSLDIETTLQAVLRSVEKLIPADFMEIALWDAENQVLVPYRFVGVPGTDRSLQIAEERYKSGEGYSGTIIQTRQPLLVPDVEARTDLQPTVDRQVMAVNSYLGVPLQVGKELVGTLELGSLTSGAFGENDLELVQLLSGQAAIALHNALVYKAEQRRSAELSSLARLAQAFGSLRDPKDLYGRLVQSISPIIPVEVLGFLIYNESTHTLEAQAPFQGIPPQFITDPEWFRIPIPSGSQAEQILLSQDVLISENAFDDPEWEELGLSHLAQSASLRDTVLVPLISGGRMLGFLQASNHTGDTGALSKDVLHLLMIIANQAAPIIENANLFQISRQRAQRAEGLRRIASLATSAANLDEILQYSLKELAHLLRADVGIILLLDEDFGCIQIHKPSLVGAPDAVEETLARIHIDDPQFHFTVTGSLHSLFSGKLSEEQTLLPVYHPLVEQFQLSSAIAVPLVVRDRGVGELWLGSHQTFGFDRGDVQMVATASGQLAGVVERSALFAQTDESLRRRVDQLTALTRITRELSTTLDLKYLLQTVYDEAIRTTRADCGTILLLELAQSKMEEPQIAVSVGDPHTPDLYPIEQRAIEQGEACIVSDFSQREEQPGHVGVQSALLVPIVHLGRPAGLIHLHGSNLNRFDQTSLEITQTLAIQVAVVLDNVLQYQEQTRRGELLNRRVETLAKVLETTQALQLNQPLEQSLEQIAAGIQQATPFQVVLISLYVSETGMLQRFCQAGLPVAAWDELLSHTQPWRSILQLLKPEFRYSRSYYIPIDQEPAIPEDVHMVTVLPTPEQKTVETWDPDDMVLIPLTDIEGNPLGLISLDAPINGRRPDRPTFDALDIFASQASLVIENQRRVQSLREQLQETQAETVRQQESLKNSQAATPALLHKDLEQTLAIHTLTNQARRVRDGLEIAEIANRQPDVHQVLRSLGHELLARLELDAALVAEQSGDDLRLLEVVGSIPEGANPEALFGQRNPLRASFHTAEMEIAADLAGSPEWQENALLNALEARSFICLPLVVDDRVAASILAVGRRMLPPLSAEDRQVYTQVGRQVAIVLQNLSLLTETRRRLDEVNLLLEFSRQIGSLDSASILSTLVESSLGVISQADAGMAALWDPKTACLVPRAAIGYASNADLLEVRYPLSGTADPDPALPAAGQTLPVQVFLQGLARRVKEVEFARDYHLSPEDLLRYRSATAGRLPVSNLLVPIVSGDTNLGVLVLENFDLNEGFSLDDEALAASLTRQAALALENARLYQDSQERAHQLQALTQVAGTITSSLQSDALIASLLEELASVTPYDTATLWLRQGDNLSVAAARGFLDSEQRLGLSVAVEDSLLFNEMVQTGHALRVPDVRQDPRFPSLVEMERFSWLGVPLIAKGELIGAIALEKTEADYYSAEHIQVVTTFAGQAAVAIENARLYEESLRRATELDERSQRLALLNRLSAELSRSLDTDHILALTANELAQALNVSVVSAVLFGQDGQPELRAEAPERDLPPGTTLPGSPLFERLRETLGIFSAADIHAEPELAPLLPFLNERGSQSLLALPLATGQELHGVLFLQTSYAYRYSLPEIELARTIGNQSAIAIQNARLFGETRRLTEELEERVQLRTAELVQEHHNTETLLRIITELSASLDMSQVLNRTLAVLNEASAAEQSAILLDRGGQIEVYHRAGLEFAPPPGEGESGNGRKPWQPEKSIAAWVTRLRKPTLVNDLPEDGRWSQDDANRVPYRSVIAVPLILGEEVLGSLQLYHRQAGQFISKQLDLVEAAARQISIAINNAELFGLIRDQSERLGGMLRDQQIEASRSRAILEAVADGVLVTDSSGRITLFNASAQSILDLQSAQVMGQSLDQFSGLFGKAAQTWMRTIRTWSRDPGIYRPGDTYAEQIMLDNGRVVSIHLAPVIWRNDFLGTVSIFRDITADVKVDRLKSEFVANVSHELRTPMTSIKGYVEILLMGAAGPLADQQTHFLRIVKSNTERLSVLVNDLLDVSRIEAGRVTLSWQPLDLKEIAEDVASDLVRRSREENKPMSIHLELAPALPRVDGDLERVSQVLWNLVSNAYNYTPENGHIEVRIRSLDETEVQLDVQDNGIGIALRDQKRIFERFYRGEDPLVLATAGTGLGLSIVKTLVEMHHGRIWFSSSGIRGEGSIFSFTLPLRQTEE